VIDETDALISYLLTVGEVTTQVGSRVHGAPGLPAGYTGATKNLVVFCDGGPLQTGVPMQDLPFQVRCYGPTPTAAHDVYEAVHDALHDMAPVKVTVTGGTKVLIAKAGRISGPLFRTEPQTGWNFWLANYWVQMSDRTVT
jgi:hypothetical protein